MLHILSPAKSLDFKTNLKIEEISQPALLSESEKLIKNLKNKSPQDLRTLMSISEKLADLNYNRFQDWEGAKTLSDNSRQAVFAFTGDVYKGLDATTLSKEEIQYAQNNLRILSGLYGVLRPLDIMEAYRLEMGTSLKIGKHNSLYEYWGDKVTEELNKVLKTQDEKVLINLASNEYFKSVNKKKIEGEIISPEFKDAKAGQYKIIAFYAKKARGLMSRFIIQHRINKIEDLKAFDLGGYRYNEDMSTTKSPVFTREENQTS